MGDAPLAAVGGWAPGGGGASEELRARSRRREFFEDFDGRLRALQRAHAIFARAERLLPVGLHGEVVRAASQLMFLATLPLTRSEALRKASHFHQVLEAQTSLPDHARAVAGYEALVTQTLLEDCVEQQADAVDGVPELATDEDWRAWIEWLGRHGSGAAGGGEADAKK